jgi:hypothetical protein
MVFCDLGSGQYTKDYFNENRYTIFCAQSFSHSVPIINGEGQKPGRGYGAGDCRIGPGAEMVLDMAGTYGAAGLLSLKRRFVFDPVHGGLEIEDRFSFSPGPLPVIERFVSLYPPEIGGTAVCIDTGDSQSVLKCSLSPAPAVHEQKHRDHYGDEVTVYLIDFAFLTEDAGFSVNFEIT